MIRFAVSNVKFIYILLTYFIVIIINLLRLFLFIWLGFFIVYIWWFLRLFILVVIFFWNIFIVNNTLIICIIVKTFLFIMFRGCVIVIIIGELALWVVGFVIVFGELALWVVGFFVFVVLWFVVSLISLIIVLLGGFIALFLYVLRAFVFERWFGFFFLVRGSSRFFWLVFWCWIIGSKLVVIYVFVS